MTDQDREVDGADGGSAGAGSGAEASRAQSQRPAKPPANVVPFPGNWFGSVDDLVPVHSEPEPAAVHPERDLGQSRLETAHVVPPLADLPGVFGGPMKRPVAPVPAAEPPAASAADASDFWEGDAAALTEVPAASESRSSIALLRSPGAAKRKPVTKAADEPYRSSDAAGGVGTAAGRGRRASRMHRPVVKAAALLVAAAGVLLLVVPHLLPGARGSGASRHRASATATTQPKSVAVVTETFTSPAVTVTTGQRARRHRHHAPKSRAGGRPPSASSSRSAAHTSASDGGPAHGDTAPPASAVVASHGSASSSGSSGTSCAAQSPDSGCLP